MSTTTTDHAPQPTSLAQLTALATAHQQHTAAQQAAAERQFIADVTEQATQYAHGHISKCFPATLARVLPAQAWTGYWEGDRDRDQDYDAVAVADLGDGMWLHHTLHVIDEDHATDHLVLITACPCGDYTHTPLRDDNTLQLALHTLTRRRTTGTCDCTRTPLATQHDGEQRILTPLHTLEDAIAHLTYDTCEDAARRAAGRAQVLDKSGGLLTDARRWRGYETGGASCYLAPGLVLYYRPTDHQYGHEYLLETAETDQPVTITSLAQLHDHLIARADGPAPDTAAPRDAA